MPPRLTCLDARRPSPLERWTLLLCLCAGLRTLAGPVEDIDAAAAKGPIETTPLRRGLTMLSGSGGNVTLLVSPTGTLFVDAGIAVSEGQIRAALARIHATTPRILIDTHYHWDHTDGNGWVHADGAVVYATASTLERLSSSQTVPQWKHTFAPSPIGARPTRRLQGGERLSFGDDHVAVHVLDPSHTDGDLFVYFEEADVLSLGDVFWNGWYPMIDTAHGGSIDGMIRAADAALAVARPSTMIVPGHGQVATRADLLAYRTMLATVRERVAAFRASGLSLAQTVQRQPTAEFDAVWGRAVISPALFTELVYTTLR